MSDLVFLCFCDRGKNSSSTSKRAAREGKTRRKCVIRNTARAASPGPRAISISPTTASARRAAGRCGEGVPRNLATAAIWYSEAADGGDEIAAERLEELRAETRDVFKGMRFV